ncbi:MAG: BREX system P-loop protein BrxC [Caloramator sp.]|nr:BREX system P-loop protein BrxC [Caloramator sp.]
MFLKDMFLKDISREITGVIKVGQLDEKDVKSELEEYVVTSEILEKLYKFYNNYSKSINGSTEKMGVWISGFFGSGKSHLLKILSYLLNNEKISGKHAVEYFEDKIKDPLLYAEMKRIADIDAETILFNIDSKNPINNKDKKDAILRIFMKVFNEHRNLCSEIPGVAYMETQLINENLYDKFKEEFYKIRGREWIDRRNAFYLERDYVAKALEKTFNVSLESAKEYLTKTIINYEFSIESFAKEVKNYIDGKGKNFHLIFLVDEIGQYIGDNDSLMLDLQTVTEDLGRYCGGRVWIIVTSQEEIDRYTKVKGNDFSKIQGRFDTRINLSSISVDEVIKRRFLEKNENAIILLKSLYRQKNAVLKNLISFTDAKKDLLGYENDDEFAEFYPFIPYQFKVLQRVFDEVRRHENSGKHLSRGERSMISAVREAGKNLKDTQEGVLVPFYMFYDAIEEFLSPIITSVIKRAENNPVLKDNPINVKVLKVLFLIKYLENEVPSNIENITTLMIDNIDADRLKLKEEIKEALRKLLSENLIQKNIDRYIFLTDDEQDVNREIRDEYIDDEEIIKELGSYLYGNIYDEPKYKYSKVYSFPFNKKIDDREKGPQTYSIGINVLTPLSVSYFQGDEKLKLDSHISKQIIIKLEDTEELIEELKETLKIESYVKKKNSNTMPNNIKNIIDAKMRETTVKRALVKQLFEQAICNGIYFVNGEKVELKGSTPKEKINSGFELLVNAVYNKLGYIKNSITSEDEVLNILKTKSEQIEFDNVEKQNNYLAEREVFEFIELQEQSHIQVRMKILLDRFSAMPYGWSNYDIAGIVASLFKQQKIKLRLNGEYLDIENSEKVVNALTKQNEVDRVIINKKVKVDPSLIRKVKNICLDLFGSINLPDDEDGLVKAVRENIDEKLKEIDSYLIKYQLNKKYPGKTLFEKGKELFSFITENKDNLSFFEAIIKKEEELLYWKDDITYPIDFFKNQVEIFEKGLKVYEKCNESSNYLNDEIKKEHKKLEQIINNPIPYGEIRNIMTIVQNIEKLFNDIIQNKKASVKEKISQDYNYCIYLADKYNFEDIKRQIEEFYKNLTANIDVYDNIYKIDALIAQSLNKKEDFENLINSRISNDTAVDDNKDDLAKELIYEKNVLKISLVRLTDKRILKKEEDVEEYIKELKQKLTSLIKNNIIEIEE